ncbi:oligoendopeptidase F [Bacteroidota bacterium]
MKRITQIVIIMVILNGLVSCESTEKGADKSEANTSKERSQVEDKYKWNLDDLYPDLETWEQAKTDIKPEIDKISQYQTTISRSGKDLYEGLEYCFNIRKEIMRLYSYASKSSDQDTRESKPLGMQQEMSQVLNEFATKAAYLDPTILEIPDSKLNQFFKQESQLEKFAQYIDDIKRSAAHTLSKDEEAVYAKAGLMAGSAHDIYSIFSNADMPRPEVTLSTGETVTLDASGYALHRASSNREDRILVFNEFFGGIDKFRRTFGTQLYGMVKENMFTKNARNYESCLEASLDRNNIPVSVYHKLIENVNKNLGTLHRYLKLRQRMLGVDELRYYDIYPPLVKDVDLTYAYDEGTDLVKESLSVLGDEYVSTLDEAFNNRWIDVYPNTGKRSGAYSSGAAYDVHPYILLNYNGKYDDVSTLTHELGHTMHSFFSNKNQPYASADYPIFLAEVASTANEALLMDHVLKNIDDPEQRLAILGSYLENARGTLFRQTQFAEFELKIHELAESGESLTGDRFTEIYLEILKKYYGHDEGVMVIDDLFGIEWAYIPHFYYNFYVFQYSTSFTASQMLADNMLKGGQEMVDNYLKFLSSGSSDYAIPTLKKVGVDMESDEPFNVAMAQMNQVMDEIEKILDETGR